MTQPNVPSATIKDKNFFFHPFTALKAHESNGGKIFVSGEKSTLTDESGKKFLDAMAGLWCVNLGYGNAELADTISHQIKKLSYYHSFSGMGNDLSEILSEKIISLTPVPMSKVFFGNSGSDANDTNAKIVWFYNNAIGKPNKKKIIEQIANFPIFFAPIDDTLFVVTKPLSNIQKPAAINATKTPPI